MGTLYRTSYRMRQATTKFGTEITLPPEVKNQPGMAIGDEVDVLYDNFVLIVPKSTTVDEERLRSALLIPADSPEEEKTASREREG